MRLRSVHDTIYLIKQRRNGDDTLCVFFFLFGLKCGASLLREQSQQFLCITLHNLNLGAKSKKPLVRNPNETCKALKSPGKLDQTSN